MERLFPVSDAPAAPRAAAARPLAGVFHQVRHRLLRRRLSPPQGPRPPRLLSITIEFVCIAANNPRSRHELNYDVFGE